MQDANVRVSHNQSSKLQISSTHKAAPPAMQGKIHQLVLSFGSYSGLGTDIIAIFDDGYGIFNGARDDGFCDVTHEKLACR